MKEKITAGKIWGVIYPGLIYEVIRNLFVILLTMILTVMLMLEDHYENPQELKQIIITAINNRVVWVTLITAAISVPVFIFLRYRDNERDKLNNRFIKYERVSVIKYILIVPFSIFFMMAANYFVSILVMAMPESMTSSYEKISGYIGETDIILQIVTVGIVGPLVEELIYRGLVYNRIKKMTGVIPAALISALFFGVFHGNWVQAPYAFLVGLACVYVYEKYKSIVAPVLLHMSANMFSVMLSTLQSPETVEETAVNVPQGELVIIYTVATLFTGAIAFGISRIIHRTVNPKEIKK